MSEDNKPETTADTEVESESQDKTEEETQKEIRERIHETIEQHKSGGDVEKAMKGDSDSQQPKAAEGGADVSTQGGTSSEPSDEDAALRFIEASVGRKFASKDEAQKYLSNLNKLVGDQAVFQGREASKILSSLEQKFGKKSEELEAFIIDLVANKQEKVEEPKVEPKTRPAKEAVERDVDPKLLERLDRLEQFEQLAALKEKYPNAVHIAGEIAAIAKAKGLSFVEAFEGSPLKDLVDSKAREDAAKSPIVTPSNRATNVDYKKAQELGRKAFSGKATEEEKAELTKLVLGL